jgi:hypothetical protein
MKHKSILVTSVALAVAGSPWVAAADEAAAQGGALEEVVITATKRESTVQGHPDQRHGDHGGRYRQQGIDGLQQPCADRAWHRHAHLRARPDGI